MPPKRGGRGGVRGGRGGRGGRGKRVVQTGVKSSAFITTQMVRDHPERRGVVPNLEGYRIPVRYLDDFVRSRVGNLRDTLQCSGRNVKGKTTKCALFEVLMELWDENSSQSESRSGSASVADARADSEDGSESRSESPGAVVDDGADSEDSSGSDSEPPVDAVPVADDGSGSDSEPPVDAVPVADDGSGSEPEPPVDGVPGADDRSGSDSEPPVDAVPVADDSSGSGSSSPAPGPVATPLPNAFYISKEILNSSLDALISDRANRPIRGFLERMLGFNQSQYNNYGEYQFKKILGDHIEQWKELAVMIASGQRTFGRGFDLARERENEWNRVLRGKTLEPATGRRELLEHNGGLHAWARRGWRYDTWFDTVSETPYILAAWTRDIQNGKQEYPLTPEQYHDPPFWNAEQTRYVLRDSPEIGVLMRRLITNGDIRLPECDELEESWNFLGRPRPTSLYIPAAILATSVDDLIANPAYVSTQDLLLIMRRQMQCPEGLGDVTLAEALEDRPWYRHKLARKREKDGSIFGEVLPPREDWCKQLQDGWLETRWDTVLVSLLKRSLGWEIHPLQHWRRTVKSCAFGYDSETNV